METVGYTRPSLARPGVEKFEARTRLLCAAFGLSAVISLAALPFEFDTDRLPESILFAFAALYLGGFLFNVVAWCLWVAQGTRNLAHLGAAQSRFSPGGAVAWSLTPLLNIAWVMYVADNLAARSMPGEVKLMGWVSSFSRARHVNLWYYCFSGSWLCTLFSSLEGVDPSVTPGAWSVPLAMAGTVLWAVAGGLGIPMARRVLADQQARLALVEAGPLPDGLSPTANPTENPIRDPESVESARSADG